MDHAFPISFPIFHIFTVYNVMIYDPFFTRKTPKLISENNSLMTPFLLCSCFSHASDKHYFSKCWGTNAWAAPPPQIFGGPSPHCLRPWTVRWFHLSRPTLANGRR